MPASLAVKVKRHLKLEVTRILKELCQTVLEHAISTGTHVVVGGGMQMSGTAYKHNG